MHEFGLWKAQPDGKSIKEHLFAAWRSSGREPAELRGPQLPAVIGYLWDWFIELHHARSSNGFGPAAIAYVELEAWSRLTGRTLTPFDVSCLTALDRQFLQAGASKPDKT